MLVYIGAISILLLFTLMLLNIKIIYYKAFNINYIYAIILLLILIEVFFFYMKNDIIYKEVDFYINWFKIFNKKSDLYTIGIELYTYNASLVLFSALILLASLIVSVNIVNNIKTSNKQEMYIQTKKYSKNFTLY